MQLVPLRPFDVHTYRQEAAARRLRLYGRPERQRPVRPDLPIVVVLVAHPSRRAIDYGVRFGPRIPADIKAVHGGRVTYHQPHTVRPRAIVTARLIMQIVAREFGVLVDDLRGPRRTKHIAESRHVAAYLIHQRLGWSLPQIGLAFGGRDHTTAMHSTRRCAEMMDADPDFAGRVARIMGVLG